jgi:hypothetical protein
MTEIADVSRVVLRLRTLASDPVNQPVIVRRGVLPSVVSFLQPHHTDQVRTVAAETLRFLSSHEDNRQIMAQEPKLVDTLTAIYNNALLNTSTGSDDGVMPNDGLTIFTRDTLSALYQFLTDKQKQQLPTLQQQLETQKKKKLRKKHNVSLSVKELTSEKNRSTLEGIILNSLRDTISYTFSVPDHRVNIYTRASTERILQTLSNNGYTCTVLLDSICETEYNTTQNADAHDKENYQPKYVERRQDSGDSRSRTLVSFDRANDSIEARLERKKRKKEKLEKQQQQQVSGSSFIGKIASIFW